MFESPLEWLLIAAVIVVPLILIALATPQRVRLARRDRAEDEARVAVCRRRGWTFRRDDRADPQDRALIWSVSGDFGPGREWDVTFRQGRRAAAGTDPRLHVEFVCKGMARTRPMLRFGRMATLEGNRRNALQAVAARARAPQGSRAELNESQRFDCEATLVAARALEGHGWAAHPPALAYSLSNDPVLARGLRGLADECPEPAQAGAHGSRVAIACDAAGLTLAMATDYCSAAGLEHLLTALERVASHAIDTPVSERAPIEIPDIDAPTVDAFSIDAPTTVAIPTIVRVA